MRRKKRGEKYLDPIEKRKGSSYNFHNVNKKVIIMKLVFRFCFFLRYQRTIKFQGY